MEINEIHVKFFKIIIILWREFLLIGSFAESQHGEVTFPEISTTILEKICQYFYWHLQFARYWVFSSPFSLLFVAISSSAILICCLCLRITLSILLRDFIFGCDFLKKVDILTEKEDLNAFVSVSLIYKTPTRPLHITYPFFLSLRIWE